MATPDPRLVAFIEAQGLSPPGARTQWTPLAGGVSSDIWRVDLPGRTLCVKCALPKLKVARDWRAPVSRNTNEWAWLNFAATVYPGAVPRPVAHDAEIGAFAMEYLDPVAFPVWKQLLLGGRVDAATAQRVGEMLAGLHAHSAGDAALARMFRTDDVFHSIRLEPYLIATAEVHPELASRLRVLADTTLATHVALVHGDVSPKNILIGDATPVFLDAECAWYGDPAFDAAFCLNHFLLKCLARPEHAEAYLSCFDAFAAAYLAGATWEPRAHLEGRTATLLPALFLARIDGKSPVEYVTAEPDRQLVRGVAVPLVAAPPARLADIARRWRDALHARPSRSR